VIRLHPFSSNEISTKSAQPEEDASVEERLNRLKNHYEEHGMRRFCEGVMLCHENNHPHVMLLQIANSFHKLCVYFASNSLGVDELTIHT
jgi:cleavage and polyadenylation specificity factor subunit 5